MKNSKNMNISSALKQEEDLFEVNLRPRTFEEYIGQEKLKKNLRVFISAAKKRGEALDHILFCGPPGLGKTTLAYVIANELGVEIKISSGPAIERRGDLAGILTNLKDRDVLFIDEIHRLNPAIEENLYPAMEEFKFDIVIGQGAHARSIRISLSKFTIIGATTRTGLLTSPLRNRFLISHRLDYYTPEELALIVQRSAKILSISITDDAADEIAKRARGTPRIANRLLRRVRDFAQIEGDGNIDFKIAKKSLERLEIDCLGLDLMDRKYLMTLLEKFAGGPVGIETLSASLNEEKDTLEDVYEPFLLQQGLIQRTPRGRIATKRAFEFFGLKYVSSQLQLLNENNV